VAGFGADAGGTRHNRPSTKEKGSSKGISKAAGAGGGARTTKPLGSRSNNEADVQSEVQAKMPRGMQVSPTSSGEAFRASRRVRANGNGKDFVKGKLKLTASEGALLLLQLAGVTCC